MARDIDDEDDGIQVRLGTFKSEVTEYPDPFMSSGDELLKISGMSTNFKRKVDRELKKNAGAGPFNNLPAPTSIAPSGREGSGSKKLEPVEVTAYAMFSVVQPTYNMDYLAKIYEINSSHFSAVQAKCANVIGLGYRLVESYKTNDKIDEIPDEDTERLQRFRRKVMSSRHKLEEKLESMNNVDSFIETLKKVFVDYEATGNGYIEIGRTNTGEIGYIGHIPATTMRVRRRRDGFVQIVNYRTTFFRNYGDTETIDQIGSDPNPNEVIHIKKYTPTNVYYGIPDVVPAINAIAGDQFASKFNLDYFENKAVPRYIITVKGAKLNSDSERKLLEFFQSGLKGSNHRSLYIPLPADEGTSKVEFKMDPVEAGVQDSSFHQYRMDNKLEILMAHRVPVTKVSILPGVSLANARDADKTFREQVAKPLQSDFEVKINKIISEMTDMFTFKLNELTLTDEDTQSKIDERYLRMKVITPNEVRIRDGKIPLESGDQMVELTSSQNSEIRTQASGNRRRDQERSANSPDESGEARNPKGEGRQVG